jgi:hypothetical protein
VKARYALALGLVIGGILASAAEVAANPGPYPVDEYEDAEDAIFTIFVHNIWTNLFWFSALLLLTCYIYKRGMERVHQKTSIFIAEVVMVALAVTALGALIDYTLLLRDYPFGISLYFNLTNWSVAVVLIFISVFASSILILDINVKAAILPAAVMAALNLIWWKIAFDSVLPIDLMTAAISIVVIPVFLVGLALWHSKRISSEDIPAPSVSTGPPSG